MSPLRETFLLLAKIFINIRINVQFKKEKKMKKNLFILGMASVFALTGCHGTKKVEFAKFKEAVEKAVEKTPAVSEVKFKGEYKGEKINFSAKFSDDAVEYAKVLASLALESEIKAEIYSLAGSLKTPSVYSVKEMDKVEYFTGAGFKIKSENSTIEWTSKALLAKAVSTEEGQKANITVSWKK